MVDHGDASVGNAPTPWPPIKHKPLDHSDDFATSHNPMTYQTMIASNDAPRTRHTIVPQVERVPAVGDALFIPETSTAEENAVLTTIECKRIHQPDGGEAPTVCFDHPYRHHVHHHRLMCGHDIVTKDTMPCGPRCMTSEFRDGKAAGAGFVCPHDECVKDSRARARRNSLFIQPQRQMRTKNARRGGRFCILSHVYGRDATADQDRRAEKDQFLAEAMEEMQIEGRGRTAARTQPKRLAKTFDKRSASPRNKADGDRYYRERSRSERSLSAGTSTAGVDVDSPEIIQLASRASGPGVGADRPITTYPHEQVKHQIELRNATLDMTGLMSENQTSNGFRSTVMKKDNPNEPPNSFFEAEEATHTSIRNEHASMYSMRDDDYLSMVEEENNITMDTEFEDLRAARHTHVQATGEYEQIATYCLCDSVADGYMLPCAVCGESFHPGCVGKGYFSSSEYETTDSIQKLRALDVRLFREGLGNGAEDLYCLACEARQNLAQQIMGSKGSFLAITRHQQRLQARNMRKQMLDFDTKGKVARRAREKSKAKELELFGELDPDPTSDMMED